MIVDPEDRPRAAGGAQWAVLIAVCLVVGWFHFWTVRSSGEEWRWGQEQKDYYNLLLDGWLDGHLHMKVEVPAALLQLKDPYDPQTRPAGLALHDASLYRGRYYLYFGVAPVVVLMLPVRLLTGSDVPLPLAVLVFTYGGFLASVVTWRAIRARYFPTARTWTTIGSVLVLGIAALGPVLLRRTHMWELPIAAGYCFAMLSLWCVFHSLHAARRATWYAGAGLCLGLAIASRPTYLIASPFLLVPLFWWWRRESRVPWRDGLAAAIPLAAIGSLMALHNYLRFDHPLQFGQAYQLSLDYESKMAHFRPAYLPFNGWRYFFSAAEWSWYFPFIQPAALPPKPAGFGGHDDVFGILANLPIAWLALAVPLAAWRRPREERGPLLAWLGTASVLFLAMAGVLCSFFGSLARYLIDFAPTCMLLATVGWLALDRVLAAAGRRWRQFGGGAVVVALAVFSVGFGVLYSLQLDGLLRERNPSLHREVARRFNGVSSWIERATGSHYGPAEFTVRLRPRPAGTQEILLATGKTGADEYRVFVRHVADGRVQFGAEGPAAPAIVSRPLAVDWSRPHELRVASGALYPPEAHPFFAGFNHEQTLQRACRLRIDFDEQPLIDAFLRLPEAARGNVRVGAAAASAPAQAFSGDVLDVRRGESPTSQPRIDADFVRLWFDFSASPAPGRHVLVRPGGGQGGAAVYLRLIDAQKAVFGVESEQGPPSESDAFDYRPGSVQPIVLRFGAAGRDTRPVRMSLDDVLMWLTNVPWSPAARVVPTDGAPVQLVQHHPDGRDPLFDGRGAFRFRLELPTDRIGRREPLIVAGRHGHGDIVSIEYVDAQTVRFAFDHWGGALALSEPVSIDYARTHDFFIDFGSGAEPEDLFGAISLRLAHLIVKINGREVWLNHTYFYNSAREEYAIGRNTIGGSTCEERFTGRILAVERVPRE